MNWIQRRIQGFREVRNWFFIRKTIKQQKKTQSWEDFGLRNGYVGQIFTVINLRKEDMGEEEMVQRMKVIQKMEPMNRYIESLGLSEIVYPEIVKLPESRSWLVVYWPLWQHFSLWRFIFQTIGLIVATKLWFAYDVHNLIATLF